MCYSYGVCRVTVGPQCRVDGNRQESAGIELRAEPSRNRVALAPEPLPSCASLRMGKLDSCRFLSIRLGVGLARNSTPVDSCRLLPIRALARPTLVFIVRLSSKRLLRSGDDHRARDAFVLPCLPRFQERSQGASVRSDDAGGTIGREKPSRWGSDCASLSVPSSERP